jgi:hypothetical protein
VAVNGCSICLKKQLKIDELTGENKRLHVKQAYQECGGQERLFGSSTPSTKPHVKPKSQQKERAT